jgi:hypothetical protein
MSNFFNLSYPDQFACQVVGYTASLSQLVIKATRSHQQETYFLTFMDVAYFEGPLTWNGARFLVADNSECMEILQQITGFSVQSKDALQEYRLFVNIPMNSSHPEEGFRIISSLADRNQTISDQVFDLK